MAGRVNNNNNGVSQFDSVARDKHTIINPMNRHPETAAILAMHAMAANQSTLLPFLDPYMVPYAGHYGQPMIVGNGKSRKKKSNRLHRSRMLRRKHRRS